MSVCVLAIKTALKQVLAARHEVILFSSLWRKQDRLSQWYFYYTIKPNRQAGFAAFQI
jgi:hypothetical protein